MKSVYLSSTILELPKTEKVLCFNYYCYSFSVSTTVVDCCKC